MSGSLISSGIITLRKEFNSEIDRLNSFKIESLSI